MANVTTTTMLTSMSTMTLCRLLGWLDVVVVVGGGGNNSVAVALV